MRTLHHYCGYKVINIVYKDYLKKFLSDYLAALVYMLRSGSLIQSLSSSEGSPHLMTFLVILVHTV